MRNIPLNLINVFLAAAEHQSFKIAADKLCLTTSAVSQSIKKLEDRIQISLFSRRTNGVELTPSGLELLKYVKAGMSEIEKGIDQITRSNNSISIFCPPGIATELMAPFVTTVIAEGYQNIRMESNEQSCVEYCDKYDIAIILDPSAKNRDDTCYLGPDYYFPFCHKKIYEQINSIEDLNKMVLFCNDHGKVSWNEWFTYNHVDFTPHKTLAFTRSSQLLSAIDSGLGIGLESYRVLSNKLKAGEYRLCNLPHLKPLVKDMTWLYINPNKKHNKQISFLENLVFKFCATDSTGKVTGE